MEAAEQARSALQVGLAEAERSREALWDKSTHLEAQLQKAEETKAELRADRSDKDLANLARSSGVNIAHQNCPAVDQHGECLYSCFAQSLDEDSPRMSVTLFRTVLGR